MNRELKDKIESAIVVLIFLILSGVILYMVLRTTNPSWLILYFLVWGMFDRL